MATLAHVIRDGLALSVIITSMTVTQTLANMEGIALLEKKTDSTCTILCSFHSAQDKINSFTCSCAAGYYGNTCQTDIDECASNPCLNGATCSVRMYWLLIIVPITVSSTELSTEFSHLLQDIVDRYICSCVAGYTGQRCDTNINECISNPCVHGKCLASDI